METKITVKKGDAKISVKSSEEMLPSTIISTTKELVFLVIALEKNESI